MMTTDKGKPPNAPINFDEFAPLNRLPMVGSYLHMMPYVMYICMLGSLIHFFGCVWMKKCGGTSKGKRKL